MVIAIVLFIQLQETMAAKVVDINKAAKNE
jgi:hypothetical protein